MKREPERPFKSRKTKRRAITRRQYGGEGHVYTDLKPPIFGGIVNRLREAFGVSKHRSARVLRFNARNR